MGSGYATFGSVTIKIDGIEFHGFARLMPPDPRIARARQRAEIDAVLREDARRFPAFATARRCVVVAAHEDPTCNLGAKQHARLLDELRRYEDLRGGLREPQAAANVCLLSAAEVGHYERARGMR